MNRYINAGSGSGAENGDGKGAPGGLDGAVYDSTRLIIHIPGQDGFNGMSANFNTFIGGAGGHAGGPFGGNGGRPSTDIELGQPGI
jgi:hypothetical protein